MRLFDRINLKLFGYNPTYSQCGEDRIVEHIFRMLKKGKLFYMDIGANEPTYGSNTFLFYENGSNGICVEPNTTLNNRIKSKRKRDLCLNIGVGNTTQKEMDFYIIDPHTLSTFSKEDAEILQKDPKYKIEKIVKVPILSFNEIVDLYAQNQRIDYVSIDVEGLNQEIVESIDFSKNRPSVFCIETLTFSTNGNEIRLNQISKKMIANDYFIYADTYINTIFIDKNVWNISKIL